MSADNQLERTWPAEKVDIRPIDELVPYERNARTHTDSQIDQVARSMQRFGWTMSVLIDENSMIIAGHARVLAAKSLGYTTAPIVVARGWTEDEKKAYVMMDNQLALNAGWDNSMLSSEIGHLGDAGFDISLLAFSDEQLKDLVSHREVEPTEGLTDEDDIPEAPAQPVTRRGDLWLLGKHRLLCGDSTSPEDVTRLMNGERAALFATDPPYLVDYDGTNHPTDKKDSKRRNQIRNKDWSGEYVEQKHWDDSSQGPQFYEAFMRVAIDHAIDEDAAWYCWHASRRQAMLEKVWDQFDVLHHQQIIWAKTRPVLTRSVMLWAHEPCLFGWQRGKKPRINREGFENWPTTVWNVPSAEIETREHPTSKPVRLFTLPMELHTRPGDLCFEPFAGSGSQLIAGERTGRRVYGMELSEAFCDVVIQRWQAFTGKVAKLDCDGRSFEEVSVERLALEGAA